MVKMNRYLFSRIKGVLVVAVALLLCNSCAANEVPLSPHDVIMSSKVTFSSGYTCKPAAIVSQAFRDSVYFHMIVGTDHAASTTLLTHRLCFAMQMGIKAENIKLIVQRSNQDTKSALFYRVKHIIAEVGITSYDTWVGAFDPNEKMKRSFSVLRNVTSLNQYILHCDLDEFPERETFQRAWEELHSPANTCDAVVAQWTDRIADGGRLTIVKASSTSGSVEKQFPLRCELSNQFVGGARTSKALIYRAPFRVDGGQHEVWCDRDGFTQQEKRAMIQEGVTDYKDAGPDKPWNRVRACNRHIEARRKTRDRRVIMKHLVNVPYRPRYCKHEVQMDHYKWIDGIRAYLFKRANDYRKKGLHWWRDSRDILMHIQNHNGKICVDCRGAQCVDTRTNTSVPADPFGVFFSRRDSYGKASWSKARKRAKADYMELVRNGEIVDTPAAKSAYATAVLGVNAVEGDMGAEVGEPSEPVDATGSVFDTNGYRKALKEAAELAQQGAV